ncbi:MAG: class C sortase [Clostridia bacterium]|nr:class C sortase [Clostridia bacterium]
MKNKLSTVILILVFLIGLSLLLYPTVSSYLNSRVQSKAIAQYVETVDNLDDREKDELISAAREYNESLASGYPSITKMTDEEWKLYSSLLDISGNGIMAYIDIPAIDCHLPIYHGTDDDILQVAAGHIVNTSLPVGGASTHCVISGHRGLPSAVLFTNLDKLVTGDVFTVSVLGETLTYEIYDIKTVLPHEIDSLGIEENQDLCTLVTCTPYGINTHRLCLMARRTENINDLSQIRVVAEASQISTLTVAGFIAVPLLIILLIIVLLPKKGSRS